MTSSDPDQDDFAKTVVRFVRDRSIASCDQLTSAESRGPLAARWKGFMGRSTAEALNALTPDVVDQVLFHFLDAIDNDQLPLAWRRKDGSYVDLRVLGHGEMGGWLMMGKGGWIERYSSQRYFDPLLDLRDDS